MKIRPSLPFILMSLLVPLMFPAFALSQETSNPSSPDKTKLKPIEVEDHTLGGLQYSVDGRILTRYQDFEELVSPLRDYETERLLKRSEASDANAQIFGAIGFVGLVTGVVGLLTTPSDQRTPFWVTAAGGAVVFDIGDLFQSEARTAKFNCVQRYNRFARGEEQVLPQGPADEKTLLDFSPGNNSQTPKGTSR